MISKNEKEALFFLNLIFKEKGVIFECNENKVSYRFKRHLITPVIILTMPLILFIVFMQFIYMRAGFRDSLRASFLMLISITMIIRGRLERKIIQAKKG